jgi:glycosyltransferase involved in cell wall biosynthesis
MTNESATISVAERTLSVVIPAYNEEENVDRVYGRLSAILDGLGLRDWEIIFALDPSTDQTESKIAELHHRDSRVRLLRMSRRFGQPAATIAGMTAASGDAVVVIDCDMQDPPELIGQLVDRWLEGFDVVYAQRRSRQGETPPKRFVAWLGYRIIRKIAEVDIPKNTGDFRLMSRRVVDNVVSLEESHGFLRGLVGLVGFKQTAVEYDRDPRSAGSSKYNQFFGSLRIGLNGVIGFSRYPLHVISLTGMFFSVVAVGGAVGYLALRLAGLGFPSGGSIAILVSFLAGIQLLSLGIMGEYVGRIYDEVRRRPKYIVESTIGFEVNDPAGERAPATSRVIRGRTL